MFGFISKIFEAPESIAKLASAFGFDAAGSMAKRKQNEAYLQALIDYLDRFLESASSGSIDQTLYIDMRVFINSGARSLPKSVVKLLCKNIDSAIAAQPQHQKKYLDEISQLRAVIVGSYRYLCTTTGTKIELLAGSSTPAVPARPETDKSSTNASQPSSESSDASTGVIMT